jgi:hypothetical protein
MKFHTSAASGPKNGQSDRERNWAIKAQFLMSSSFGFVLVLVLVLEVVEPLSLVEDEHEDDDEHD